MHFTISFDMHEKQHNCSLARASSTLHDTCLLALGCAAGCCAKHSAEQAGALLAGAALFDARCVYGDLHTTVHTLQAYDQRCLSVYSDAKHNNGLSSRLSDQANETSVRVCDVLTGQSIDNESMLQAQAVDMARSDQITSLHDFHPPVKLESVSAVHDHRAAAGKVTCKVVLDSDVMHAYSLLAPYPGIVVTEEQLEDAAPALVWIELDRWCVRLPTDQEAGLLVCGYKAGILSDVNAPETSEAHASCMLVSLWDERRHTFFDPPVWLATKAQDLYRGDEITVDYGTVFWQREKRLQQARRTCDAIVAKNTTE